MPKALDSESALLEYIAVTPGALGYVSRILPEYQGTVKAIPVIK